MVPSRIRCICGKDEASHDDNEHGRLIPCNRCHHFQHLVCMGYDEDPDPPWLVHWARGFRYYCEQCGPHMHTATLSALAAGNRRIWEQRWQAWKEAMAGKAQIARASILHAVQFRGYAQVWMEREQRRAELVGRTVMLERDVVAGVLRAMGLVIDVMSDAVIVQLDKEMRASFHPADGAWVVQFAVIRHRQLLTEENRDFVERAFKDK